MNYILVTYESRPKTLFGGEDWNVRGIFSTSDEAITKMREINCAVGEKRHMGVSLKGVVYKCVLKVPVDEMVDLRLMDCGYPLSDTVNHSVHGVSVIAEESTYTEPPR